MNSSCTPIRITVKGYMTKLRNYLLRTSSILCIPLSKLRNFTLFLLNFPTFLISFNILLVIKLLLKQWKKKLALPLLIMAGSFIASYIFKINIMQIILADAVIGFFCMRDPQYN